MSCRAGGGWGKGREEGAVARTHSRKARAVALKQQVQRVIHLPLGAATAKTLAKGDVIGVDAEGVMAHPKGGDTAAVGTGDGRLM